MHPAAPAARRVPVMLDHPGRDQRDVDLLVAGVHAQISRGGQILPALTYTDPTVRHRVVRGRRPGQMRPRRTLLPTRPPNPALPGSRRPIGGGLPPGSSSLDGGTPEFLLLRETNRSNRATRSVSSAPSSASPALARLSSSTRATNRRVRSISSSRERSSSRNTRRSQHARASYARHHASGSHPTTHIQLHTMPLSCHPGSTLNAYVCTEPGVVHSPGAKRPPWRPARSTTKARARPSSRPRPTRLD
jgi:hypothetical protein